MADDLIKRELDSKNAELRIVVPIAEDVWKQEQKNAFNKLAKKVKVPGFRPGKAPEHELKKHVATTRIWEEAIGKLLNVAVKEAAKKVQDDDIILDSPTYAVEKVTETELEITFIYPIFPDLKIKNYKNLNIKFNRADEPMILNEVEQQLDKMLLSRSLLLPKEGKDAKVDHGDTIIFDFKGFMDDQPFNGGEAKDYELKIGSGVFIPGFEDKLVGKKLGWKGDINVRFPADYYKEEFKDREAKFSIKIKEIKYNDKPALDEQFIKSLNIANVQDETQLRTYLRGLAQRELEEKARTQFMDDLLTKVISENEVPVPRTIALKEMDKLLKKFKDNLKQQGVSERDYYEVTSYTEERVKQELLAEATKTVKKSLLQSFFAKELAVKPSEEDFLRHYQRLAKLYNMDGDMIQTMVKEETIEPQLVNELTVDQLILLNNPGLQLEKEAITIKKFVAPAVNATGEAAAQNGAADQPAPAKPRKKPAAKSSPKELKN